MENLKKMLKNDFKNYKRYNVLQIILVLTVLFSSSMAFFPNTNSLIYVYITVFVFPVIIFSISIFSENNDKTLLPLAMRDCTTFEIIFSKIISALLILLIPFVMYTIVMVFILNMGYNVFLFLLIYILAAIMHVIVGIVLAIISKSSSVMSISYLAYIIIFSLMPIFYSNGLIPEFFQYALIVSPAYLSGILFEEVIYGYAFSPDWLLILSVLLQITYIITLSRFIIRPNFKSYLLYAIDEEKEVKK